MAAKERLSDKFADTAQGPSDHRPYIIYYDTETRGFGLRVTKAGAKSWILNYRAENGVERRLTIGTHRDPWREAAARKEALRLKALIDQGRDPQGDRVEKRTAPTVNEMILRWRTEHSPKNRPRSRMQNEYTLKQWIEPELGTRKVAELRFTDVDRLHAKITRAGTPARANRTLALLSRMCSLAITWGWRTDNPCKGIERNHEEKRVRYLSKAELPRLLAALDEHPNKPAAAAIRLLLLTGARKGEALKAHWTQFDLEAGVWTKPSSHTKQRRVHFVPLGEEALALLAALQAGSSGREEKLFAGLKDLKIDWAKICQAAGITGLRIHDLRHSFASMLVSDGASLPLIGALLGHSSPATTARYTHLFDKPQREAVAKLGARISAAGAPRGEVVELSRKARS